MPRTRDAIDALKYATQAIDDQQHLMSGMAIQMQRPGNAAAARTSFSSSRCPAPARGRFSGPRRARARPSIIPTPTAIPCSMSNRETDEQWNEKGVSEIDQMIQELRVARGKLQAVNEIEEVLQGKLRYLDRRFRDAQRDCHWQTAERMAAEIRETLSRLDKVRGRSMESLKLENVVISEAGFIRKRKGYTLIERDSVDGIVAELRQRVDQFTLG